MSQLVEYGNKCSVIPQQMLLNWNIPLNGLEILSVIPLYIPLAEHTHTKQNHSMCTLEGVGLYAAGSST